MVTLIGYCCWFIFIYEFRIKHGLYAVFRLNEQVGVVVLPVHVYLTFYFLTVSFVFDLHPEKPITDRSLDAVTA